MQKNGALPARVTCQNRLSKLFLLLPLLFPPIALLWLPFYNSKYPAFLGFPFFYWYQFLWVPLTSLLLYLVYRYRYRQKR